MALCEGGLAKIRDLWHHVTPELTDIITKTTEVTGKIKALEANPTVDAIVKVIPYGTEVEGWLNKGIDAVVKIEQGAKNLAEKISAWLDGKTELESNGNLLKLANATTQAGHAETGQAVQHESFYDSAIQLHIIATK